MPESSLSSQSEVDIQQIPLLEPKLHPPRLHTTLVEREHLLAKLDAIREQKLTLLCAPAGSGKTTALGQWMAKRDAGGQDLPVAWVALEKSDNDPLRFWRYVMTACRSFGNESGQTALAHITAALPTFALPSLEKLLTLFLNDLTRLRGSGLLILEDYHLITEPHIHKTLLFFLDHLPVQIHMVILTRSEPPLPLARWRVRGELGEITATDLRFSRQEAESFLRQTLAITPDILSFEALSQIERRLEGWAAGLRLLALAIQGATRLQEVERVIVTFAGGQRSLQEYFVSEVLDAQPEPWQDFLLRTSMLARLNGSLCDTVAECQGSERLLEKIERTGLFLESLDRSGGWYRYHALFAEAMQTEARRRLGEAALRDLALRASHWCEQHGMVADAIEAAFQAQDLARASSLIENLLSRMKHFVLAPQVFEEINGFHTLRRWLEALPSTAFRGHPWLSLGYATALLFVFVVDQQPSSEVRALKREEYTTPYAGFLSKIEKMLQMAIEDFKAAGDIPRAGGALTFRSLIAREQGRIGAAMEYAREGIAWLPADEQEWRMLGLNVIGMGKLINGELEEARTIFLGLCSLCEGLGNRAILRANSALLTLVYYEQGKLHQTATFFEQMLAEAREENDYDDIAHSSLLLAWHAYEWNDLQVADQRARESLELGQKIGNEEFQVLAELVLARIEHIRGETAHARQRCTALLARLPAISPLRHRLHREIQLAQASFALASDDLAAVELWRINNPLDLTLPLSLQVREELLEARWLRVQERSEEVLASLTHRLDEALRSGRIRSALEIQVVLLLLRHSCDHTQEVGKMLQALLARALAEGYLRLFLDEGEALLTLLRVSLPQIHKRALITYAQSILRAATSTQAPQLDTVPAYTLLVEPLSPQERRVLRLLIAGHSNPEIARDLIVSVNTVKAHIKNIYRKLDVKNRLEASEAARRLGFD